ncbi:MAG: dehydrogenase [Methylophilaceae bacterium]
MTTIYSRAPLRLSLSGGGTDIKSFSDKHEGVVINFTINKYVYTKIKAQTKNKVTFISNDLGINECFNTPLKNIKNSKLVLHQATYLKIMKLFNNDECLPLQVETLCENPPGSGLGTSSALVVSMIKAYDEMLNLQLPKHQIASLAYEIERIDCNYSGGQQDQYASSYGGFNYMQFKKNGDVVVDALRLEKHTIVQIEQKAFIYFSGVSRDSSRIISDQKEGFEKKNNILNNIKKIKKEAIKQKKILMNFNLKKLVNSINRQWILKKNTSKKISNSYIDSIMNLAIQNGALCGKVSGAGGGGFFLFIVNDPERLKLKKILTNKNGYVENFQITFEGAFSWKE